MQHRPSMAKFLAVLALVAAFARPGTAVSIQVHLGSRVKDAAAGRQSPEAADSRHAPALMAFLRELKSEANVGLKRGKLVSNWCRSARTQQTGMAGVLQRQLHEAKLAVRQVEIEEERLSAEAQLANATRTQKLNQLSDASDTAGFAAGEFKNEQEEMQRTIDAASHSMTLIEMQDAGVDSGSGGGQGGSTEASVDALLGDADSSSTENSPRARAQQLMLKLRRMYTQLAQKKTGAVQEHNSMLERLWSFTDKLNSSIMEAQSQVAAISMETAQRKREHARLSGRIAGLSSLLQAANVSSHATEVTCSEEEAHRADVASYIAAESNSVNAIMGHMAGGLSQPDSKSVAFLQVAAESTGTQVRRALDDVQAMAHDFPEESEWYASALAHLSTLHGMAPSAAASAPAAVAVATSGEAASGEADGEDADADPLKSIRQFVSDGSGSAAAPVTEEEAAVGYSAKQMPDVEEVRTLYTGLIGRVRSKARIVAEEQSMCSSVLQHGALDDGALRRSTKRVDAKLHIAQATMAEYARSLEFDEAQGKLVGTSQQQLHTIASDAAKEGAGALEALREHAQRLVSVASEMMQSQDSDATWVKDLLRKVEEHQAMLRRRSQRFASQAAAIEAADTALLEMLGEDATLSRRHFVKARAEFRLLQSRARAKEDNQALSGHFQESAGELCSGKRLQQLKDKSLELQKEERALQSNIPKALQQEV